MKSPVLPLIAIALSASPAMANISQPTSVLELFTSQGCSSCPKANRFVVDLDQTDPDTLSLSYGVTYWDYLGWKDTFGSADFTARQRQYDSVMESGMYTPMMVVAGRAHAPRVKVEAIKAATVPPSLRLVRKDDQLCIDADLPMGSKIAMIDYVAGTQNVPVKKGENRGRTLTLANVVTDIAYAEWSGDRLCGRLPGEAFAVLAHDATTSEIIGAARYEPR